MWTDAVAYCVLPLPRFRLISIYGADPNHSHTSQPKPPEGTRPMYHGRTALIAAAEYGHGECVVKLLRMGAEVSLTDK